MTLTLNNFSFNDNYYFQIHGTAMVLKWPSYQHFSGYFEASAVENAPFQLQTWLRYISMIGTDGPDNPKNFHDHLN